jgi:hypothetical protein
MSEYWDEILDKVEAEVRPILQEFIAGVAVDLGTGIDAYARLVSDDMVKWVAANMGSDDETAKRNLRHLRAILVNLAVTEHIQLHNKTLDVLEKGIGIVLRVLISALRITLV